MEPTPLSPEIQAGIHKFAREVTTGTRLEQEFEEELAAHVEDKVRGYLTGADPITEDDALLLARRHFGNPQVVRALLQETHAGLDIRDVRRALTQRVATATSAMFLSATVAQILHELWWRTVEFQIVWIESPASYIRTGLLLMFSLHVGLALVGPAVMYFLLRRRGKLSYANNTISMSQLRLRVLTSMLIFIAVDVAICNLFPPFAIRAPTGIPYYHYELGVAWLQMLTPALSALVWVWWCDRKPFRLTSVVFALLGWTLTTTLITQITFGTSIFATYTLGMNRSLSHYLNVIGLRLLIILASGIVIAGIFDGLHRWRQSRQSEAQLTTDPCS